LSKKTFRRRSDMQQMVELLIRGIAVPLDKKKTGKTVC